MMKLRWYFMVDVTVTQNFEHSYFVNEWFLGTLRSSKKMRWRFFISSKMNNILPWRKIRVVWKYVFLKMPLWKITVSKNLSDRHIWDLNIEKYTEVSLLLLYVINPYIFKISFTAEIPYVFKTPCFFNLNVTV